MTRFPAPPPAGMYPAPTHEGMRVTFPNHVPVSPPGFSVPSGAPVGDMGKSYGIHQFSVWAAGETDVRQVLDVRRAESLWRVSIFGRLLLTINYGTVHNREILQLQAPLVITFPGQLTVNAQPLDDEGAQCVVTLTQATAGGASQARKSVDSTGGTVALDEGAVRYVALTASTLTISGITPVAVPALSTVPLVSGSVLLTGSGFQEFEA